jgi:hypothetical protein
MAGEWWAATLANGTMHIVSSSTRYFVRIDAPQVRVVQMARHGDGSNNPCN